MRTFKRTRARRRRIIAAVKRILVALLLLAVAACSSQSSPAAFTLGTARVDAKYACPAGSTDAKYDVHATVVAHNSTAKDVTIEAATAEMTLAAVSGTWLEKVGDRYAAGTVKVTPTMVAHNSDRTLDVTIPSSCTSGRNASAKSSSGSYTVTIYMATTAGAFSVKAGNRHEIVAS